MKNPMPSARLLFFTLLSFCVPATTHAADPQVEIRTSLGTIVLELYPDKAPRTVENFLGYVREGHYAGTLFHRVIPGFMIQGGGYDKTLKEKPEKGPIRNEAANGLRNETGTIAMARTSDPHSATAQFFINVADNTFLDHTAPTPRGYGYTVFGRVTQGMEIVNRIATTPTGSAGPFAGDVPVTPVVIEAAKLLPAATTNTTTR